MCSGCRTSFSYIISSTDFCEYCGYNVTECEASSGTITECAEGYNYSTYLKKCYKCTLIDSYCKTCYHHGDFEAGCIECVDSYYLSDSTGIC